MTLYSKIINFFETSKSKHLLGFVSFIESIFFPIPPDLILIPMVLSKKFDWMRLALLTTLTSVLGGILGYYIGIFLFNEINIYIIEYGYLNDFNFVKNIFIEYGVLVLFISGFTPIPYKIFTITAGFMAVNIFMFIGVSIIGRGLRFYLVAYLTNKYREDINLYLGKYLLQITALVLIVFLIYKLYI